MIFDNEDGRIYDMNKSVKHTLGISRHDIED